MQPYSKSLHIKIYLSIFFFVAIFLPFARDSNANICYGKLMCEEFLGTSQQVPLVLSEFWFGWKTQCSFRFKKMFIIVYKIPLVVQFWIKTVCLYKPRKTTSKACVRYSDDGDDDDTTEQKDMSIFSSMERALLSINRVCCTSFRMPFEMVFRFATIGKLLHLRFQSSRE